MNVKTSSVRSSFFTSVSFGFPFDADIFGIFTEKDVNRTDRTMAFYAGENNPNLTVLSDILMTYVMYNFDIGYVQGMSDLLSPILCLLRNEVDTFWCFVGFMDKVVSALVLKHLKIHIIRY